MSRYFRLAALLALLGLLWLVPQAAHAQGCGPSNPNCIVPTAPIGTSDNRAASTAFVQQNGGFTTLSGDCTATSLGVITCTKTNGTPFGTLAVQNANAVAITGGTITGLPNPTNATDAATKNYVDSIASGIVVLAPSGLATAAVLPNSPTYANGTLGVGATLTAGSNTTLTVDGTAAPLSTVVLVKNQASAFQNGIYTVTQAGSGAAPWILTRATYFDQAAEMKAGSYTFVTGGTANAGSAYTLLAAVATVGTDPLTWLLFSQGSGSVASGGAVISSRAAAVVQNLSGFSTISTLGYAAGGDGGGATFKSIGPTTPFTDTYILTGHIGSAGSGYVNGSYLGVGYTGGTGNTCNSQATVSGTAVTSLSFAIPCPGYSVGDVLTIPNQYIGGSGSGFTYIVDTISAPTASFTDAAGHRFQFVPDQGGVANAKQFGCKGDWAGTDVGATNNLLCMQNLASWASQVVPGLQFGIGSKVFIPRGNYMMCGSFGNTSFTLVLPQGVWFDGAGIFGTSLIECALNPAGNQFIALCDANFLVGQYGCRVSNMVLSSLQISSSTAGAAVIYSNSGQQFVLGENLEIDGGFKGCIRYEIGKGGAANDIWLGINCNQFGGSTNAAYWFNAATAQHFLERSVAASTGTSALAILHQAGRLVVNGFDIEGYTIGLQQQVTSGNTVSSYKNVQESSGSCAAAITLSAGNIPGNIIFENVVTGCPITINNGQTGGANFNSQIVKQIICVSGPCS